MWIWKHAKPRAIVPLELRNAGEINRSFICPGAISDGLRDMIQNYKSNSYDGNRNVIDSFKVVSCERA